MSRAAAPQPSPPAPPPLQAAPPPPPAVPPPSAPGTRWLVRVVGLGLLVGALVPFWQSLQALDHRDYVSSLLAGFVGWFVAQAGIELVRPESAE